MKLDLRLVDNFIALFVQDFLRTSIHKLRKLWARDEWRWEDSCSTCWYESYCDAWCWLSELCVTVLFFVKRFRVPVRESICLKIIYFKVSRLVTTKLLSACAWHWVSRLS